MITKYPGSYFMSASYIMEAVRGLFCFYGMKVALFKKSSCCKVGIGQQAQAQCNRLAFRVLTQGRRNGGGEGGHIPPSFG